MTLQALLVSKDDQAAEMLTRALAGFGVAVERSSDPEVAATRLADQSFDAVVVDFDEPGEASSILQLAAHGVNSQSHRRVITLAMVGDPAQVRGILGAGAHFIVGKPVFEEQVAGTLYAAASLLKRERRRSFRVPVQAAVTLALPDGQQLEGIMLDLSDSGMDVLCAQALAPTSLVSCLFALPDGSADIEAQGEVAWGNTNGQTGIHFVGLEEPTASTLREWVEKNAPEPQEDEQDAAARCKLTDLSLGGCYVETSSPFPERSAVDLCLRAGELEFHAAGTVRVMHPVRGMGIEFPSRTEEQRKVVTDFIEFLTSQPGTTPELFISPKSLVADAAESLEESDPSEDPLLDLLRNGQSMEEVDFLAELRRQRNSEPVNS